jgi:phage terminase large subunit-like protein
MKQTKPTNKMTKENAFLIYELLCNAGWIDDADELLAYIVDEEGVDAAKEKSQEIKDLINLINPLLDTKIDIDILQLEVEEDEDEEDEDEDEEESINKFMR